MSAVSFSYKLTNAYSYKELAKYVATFMDVSIRLVPIDKTIIITYQGEDTVDEQEVSKFIDKKGFECHTDPIEEQPAESIDKLKEALSEAEKKRDEFRGYWLKADAKTMMLKDRLKAIQTLIAALTE